MTGMQFPLVGGAYLSRSLKLDAQRCVNLFPVLGGSGTAKAVSALFGTPGLRRLATLPGAGGVRALYVPSNGGNAIAIRGADVFRVAPDWTATKVATLDTAADLVSVADNGSVALLVMGAYGYTLDLYTNELVALASGFTGSDHVSFNKTVFVFNEPNTAKFYITEAGVAGVQFDALDFATAVSNAEPIIRHIINHEELILFKRTTTEIWRAIVGGDFLYSRDNNAAIEKGCQAKHSVVPLDNTIYWLGGDRDGGGIVWRLNGYTPERVSHDGLEFAIQNYGDVSDAQAWSYQQEGHTFYVLTFPSAGATWCYDVATNLWHERAYLDPGTGTFGRHRSACHMYYGGVHVVGDWEDGRLYALDLDCYDDDGDPLVALRAAPHIAGPSFNEIRYNRIRIDLETGIGANDGSGSDPLMMLSWSDDGGRTWGPEQFMSMGKLGDYKFLAELDRLGASRDRVFQISISDPVKRAILGASVDAVDLGR